MSSPADTGLERRVPTAAEREASIAALQAELGACCAHAMPEAAADGWCRPPAVGETCCASPTPHVRGSCHAGAGTGGPGMSGHGCMEGMPAWAGMGALLLAALVSVAVLRRGARAADRGFRFDLMGIGWIRAAVSHRLFQPALQTIPLLLFFGVVWAGLAGTPVPERNLATVLVWGIWWVLLIVDIVLLGRSWCLVCPWEALAGFARRLTFWRRGDEPLALDQPWPRWLRSVYPATALFLVLTWLELGHGVTFSPRATAWLGIGMLLMAVSAALLYEKRAFCKYACLVGRICGLYSLMAPVEVRAADPEACLTCRTKDCVFGNENGYPCPTAQYPAKMETNAYCTVCTECVKSCPQGNIALNLRPWGADLKTFANPRRDEAVLAIAMLAMTSFHGLTMTPAWTRFLELQRRHLGFDQLTGFTLGMALFLALPALVFYLVADGAAEDGAPEVERGRYVATMAYPMVAVALMYHLAHNAGHFFGEGLRIVPVLSDPLGYGWDLFGSASVKVVPLLSMPAIWALQLGCVLIGHYAASAAIVDLAGRFRAPRDDARGTRLMLLLVLVITAGNLWLLGQPMEMRSGL